MAEWLKAHAWRACIPHKGIEGSNPSLSVAGSLAPREPIAPAARIFSGRWQFPEPRGSMLIRRSLDIPTSEITDERLYLSRREFLGAVGGVMGAVAINRALPRLTDPGDDKPTPYESITHYNNFYEFGTDKEDPAEEAKNFKTRPWKVKVDGEVAKPAEYDFDDLVKPYFQGTTRRSGAPS